MTPFSAVNLLALSNGSLCCPLGRNTAQALLTSKILVDKADDDSVIGQIQQSLGQMSGKASSMDAGPVDVERRFEDFGVFLIRHTHTNGILCNERCTTFGDAALPTTPQRQGLAEGAIIGWGPVGDGSCWIMRTGRCSGPVKRLVVTANTTRGCCGPVSGSELDATQH